MKKIAFSLLFVGLAACTSGGRVAQEKWTDFNNSGTQASIPQNLAGVVFYREKDIIPGKSVNIYVNEEYLASLLPGGFQTAAVCPNNQRVHAEFTGADAGYYRKHTQGDSYNLVANDTVYFEVVPDSEYGVGLRAVDAETGRDAIAHLKRQNHTLPRLNKKRSCEGGPLKQYTLDASALFHFNKSDYSNMLPKGKQEIQKVAQDISQYGAKVSRIEVIGYTDPDGSDSYNLALSQRRAATVKQALEAGGINGSIIQPTGRGEQNLVVPDCEARYPNNAQARQSCNQPNRRVEINLY